MIWGLAENLKKCQIQVQFLLKMANLKDFPPISKDFQQLNLCQEEGANFC